MIAIIDFRFHDIGLKILFPDADYFILIKEFERTDLNLRYNVNPILHSESNNIFSTISNGSYDTLFVIAPLIDGMKIYNEQEKPFVEATHLHTLNLISLIKQKKFRHICVFDNYDYDYDPNIIFSEDPSFVKENNIIFFKRNYCEGKQYQANVFSFPYLIFGYQCNIDMLGNHSNYNQNGMSKIPRLFFSGTLFRHEDSIYNIIRDRRNFYGKLISKNKIYNPGQLPHDVFMRELASSKYCLDLLGVGDPNIRTFEILSVGSLRIGQRSNLKWPFSEDFCAETIFDDENDLCEKIKTLESNPELYNTCLQKQNYIVDKYMNANYLRSYLLESMNNH
jgi:hypothetical protein